MTVPMVATARDEAPVFFRSGTEELFGILTEPTADANGLCAVHLAGKGPSIATVSRGRMSVLLARRLAGLGFHSFRIEYCGTGDSTGDDWEWSVTEPSLDELHGALVWLHEHAFDRVVLIGTCGGARIGLETARFDERIAGLVLLLPPLRDSEPWRRYDTLPTRHLVRRLLQRRHVTAMLHKGRRRMYLQRARSDLVATLPSKLGRRRSGNPTGGREGKYRWIGPDALHGLEEMVDRRIPILMFFGTDDNDYRDWLEATKGPVGPLLERAGDLIRIELVEGRYYDNPTPEVSARIARAIVEHVPGVLGNGSTP